MFLKMIKPPMAVLLMVALTFAINLHQMKPSQDAKPTAPINTNLEELQEYVEINTKATNNPQIQPVIPRGETGIISYISYKIMRPFLESRLDAYISQMGFTDFIKKNTDKTLDLKLKDITLGNGKMAMCGSAIDVRIDEPSSAAGGIINISGRTRREQYRFTVGRQSEIRGLELAVIGMKEGGTREVWVPANLSTSKLKTTPYPVPALYKITLLKVLTSPPEEIRDLYYIDHKTTIEKTILCGDRVAFSLSLIDPTNGQKIYETTEPIIWRLGEQQKSPAIEYGLLGMNKGGTRVIFTPGYLTQPLEIPHISPGLNVIEIQVIDVAN